MAFTHNAAHSGTVKKDWRLYNWQQKRVSEAVWCTMQRVLAVGALLVLSPLFLLLFCAVKATSKGPFIYQQERPGQHGRRFTAFKIRTMKTGADQDAARARRVDKSDPMITPVGKLLRDLKLDELPQLVNVVKGDMALVGPRPIASALQQELEQKIPGFRRRLNVHPGLSSLAQVCIFDNAEDDKLVEDWSTRFEAELDYLYKRSVGYDIVIIGLTILFVAKKIFRKIPRRVHILAVAVMAGLLLTGCAERLSTHSFNTADQAFEKSIPAYGARQTPTALDIQPVSVPPEEDREPERDYHLGTGDRLVINVFGEPGLEQLLVQIDGFGNIQLPYLEQVPVAGMTISEIQQNLKKSFSKQFRDPWVVVQIADYKSRPVYLLGQFNNPGVIYLNGPTNLMQAMTMGQGLSESAHLRGARLWRNGQIAAVDMQALLREGRPEHNVYLRPGDTLYVPSQSDQKAYVLGAVVRAGAIPFANEPMTLLKALSQVGGPVKASALLSQVRIIRTHSALDGQLILVNAKDILKGRAPDMELMPDDIVYIPDNWMENWNQVIRAVTPTLQLAGGALQPFVQVKFLKGD